MSEHKESAERLNRPLIRLAKMMGIGTSYVGMSNDYHEIADDVIIDILASLNVDASSDESITQALHEISQRELMRLIEPTVLHTAGEESRVHIHTSVMQVPTVSLTLEDGTVYDRDLSIEALPQMRAHEVNDQFILNAAVIIPDDVPVGYHTLTVTLGERTDSATLVSAPERIEMLDPMKEGSLWGWMAQLYSIRSAGSWGVGDFADLQTLLTESKTRTGADFMLINPVHAAEPVSPLTPSPYLPVSRRFINFTYIRPERIPEYRKLDDDARAHIEQLRDQVDALNTDPQIIDRDAMWKAKMPALWTIFEVERDEVRQRLFNKYKNECGDELEAYATWCLCYDKWGAPCADPDNWEVRLNKTSPEVCQLREENAKTLEFYKWLEWVATQQLHEAQSAAREAGMRIGIMSDMAVGVHPQGSDVWWNPERFARGATVGAPPDMFNQQGQDWSQPPLSPLALKETGYKAYREMVRGMFDNAGAVRIDHILGLFRLWWIPQGRTPVDGAYVYYDEAIMLGILALEASRVGGIVVGEDLGVVPAQVSQTLAARGVLGCAVEWFEQMDGVFTPPKHWRPYALASVNTHDMPPAAGYLEYEHVKIRERLGLLEEGDSKFEQDARAEHLAMLQMLCDNGYLDPQLLKDQNLHEEQIVDALYRALKGSPCKLLAASITDAVGEKRAQNQPGTNNEYPNWRIPLADGKGNTVMLEDMFDLAQFQRIVQIMDA